MKQETLENLKKLPLSLQNEVEFFIEFLAYKNDSKTILKQNNTLRKAGFLEGKIKILEGFDNPIEDFKDYM